MAETETLKNMVLTFRVSELQTLLGFAGRNKLGRKPELQARALELLRLRHTAVQMKIRALYKSIKEERDGSSVSWKQQQQQQPRSKPAAAVSLSSTAAASTARRYLQTVDKSTRQQHLQPQQRSTVYQQAGCNGQAPDRQMQTARGMHPNDLYQYQPMAHPPASAASSHLVVKLKCLPFYDVISEILRPSSFGPQGRDRLQEGNFLFYLYSQDVTHILCSRRLRTSTDMEYTIQVQMRFCLLDTTCEQDDCFPPGIRVTINGKMCPLPDPILTNKPGVEPKRPPRPVNITTMVKLFPLVANRITVSWDTKCGHKYAIAVYLVQQLTSSELLQRLKTRSVRHLDLTRDLIKEKLSEDTDCEIATTSLSVSLVCPVGKMRMTTPCRASTCYHLQCFDASLYLQMNEKNPTWTCPVCDKPASYDNLVIDGYFMEVLLSGELPADCNEIQLHQDGSWSSLVIEEELAMIVSPMPQEKSVVNIRTVSDDVEVMLLSPQEEPKQEPTVIDLTLSDSEDEENAQMKSNTTNEPGSPNQTLSSAAGIVLLSSREFSEKVSQLRVMVEQLKTSYNQHQLVSTDSVI